MILRTQDELIRRLEENTKTMMTQDVKNERKEN